MIMGNITVQTNVNADIQKVWDYYTSPEHITQWNYANDSWHCPKVQNDVKVGGRFTARMEAKDASEGFYFGGKYIEVIYRQKMSYVMDDNRHVLVEFINNGNNIDIIVMFDSDNENSSEIQKKGWQSILNNFKKYTESN